MKQFLEHSALPIGIILLATAACYWPGLDSLFLFDDSPNLDALVHIRDASPFSAGFREFVFSGQAGPTGRPVSLFTFALQADAWPDNPVAFKLVNVLIHCLTAVLVYLCSYRLAQHLRGDHRLASLVAIVTALAWALQTVHTSTVLYAVQRMALLSNFFMLLGIFCHLAIRLGNDRNEVRKAGLLTLALATTGLLALFSKENAPTLVFYLLVLEYTLLSDLRTGVVIRRWRLACLWLPAIILVLLPVVFLARLQAGYEAAAEFTLVERLLTETRILWQYLAALVLPDTGAIGIFHDVPVSTSLLNPATTLFAILAWLAVLGLVLVRPGRHRLWLFALCWFWSGHLVESTVLALELFFHHRNYLAFYGIVFALVFAFFNWLPDTVLRFRARLIVAGVYLCLLALNTARISLLWSQPLQLAERWYEADPATSRNAEFYAMQLAQYGDEGEQLAAAVLARAADDNPDNYHLLLNLATLGCVNPGISAPDESTLLARAGDLSVENRNLVTPMQQIVNLHLQGNCPAYDNVFLARLMENLSPGVSDHDRGMFQFERARLANARGEPDAAMALMESAWNNAGDPGILFNLAVLLINAGRYTEALGHIDQAIDAITTENNIRTGTRDEKLAALGDMREDVLGFMAESTE